MTHAIDHTTRAVFWRCGDNGGSCSFCFASVGFFRLAAWTLVLCRMLGYCALPKVPSAFDKVVTGLLLPLVSRLQSFWLCPRYLACAALHQHAKMLNRSCYVSLNLDFFGTLLFIQCPGILGEANLIKSFCDQKLLPLFCGLRISAGCVCLLARTASRQTHLRGFRRASRQTHSKCVCLLARWLHEKLTFASLFFHYNETIFFGK